MTGQLVAFRVNTPRAPLTGAHLAIFPRYDPKHTARFQLAALVSGERARLVTSILHWLELAEPTTYQELCELITKSRFGNALVTCRTCGEQHAIRNGDEACVELGDLARLVGDALRIDGIVHEKFQAALQLLADVFEVRSVNRVAVALGGLLFAYNIDKECDQALLETTINRTLQENLPKLGGPFAIGAKLAHRIDAGILPILGGSSRQWNMITLSNYLRAEAPSRYTLEIVFHNPRLAKGDITTALQEFRGHAGVSSITAHGAYLIVRINPRWLRAVSGADGNPITVFTQLFPEISHRLSAHAIGVSQANTIAWRR